MTDHTDPRVIRPDTDRCPECGGYGQRGCGAAWHDGKPDTHCSPACQCRDDMRRDLRHWHARAELNQAELRRIVVEELAVAEACGGLPEVGADAIADRVVERMAAR